MDDVMKKRLIGVAVLVVIGVLTPLLLSKCMHSGGDDGGDGSMRVYNVNPSGSAESASNADGNAAAANDQSNGQGNDNGKKQTQEDASQPDAVSPQSKSSKSSDEAFSTPPVKGRNSTSDKASEGPDNAQTSSHQSQPPAHKQTSHGPASDQKKSSSSESASQSSAKAQRNDSASGWVVQIAAFGDADNARAMVNELSGQYRASYAKVTVNGKTWYRVNVGPFSDKDAARASADSLKSQGRKPLVRHLP